MINDHYESLKISLKNITRMQNGVNRASSKLKSIKAEWGKNQLKDQPKLMFAGAGLKKMKPMQWFKK